MGHECHGFFFWLCLRSCWILVPQQGMEPQPSAAEPWTPKHWTTREVPRLPFIENLTIYQTCV